MCRDKDHQKIQILWSLFMNKIDMSPGFVPLLVCKLQT